MVCRLDAINVFAPLAQALHFRSGVGVFLAFRFDDRKTGFREFDDKIGVVVANVAVGIHVIQLEIYGEIVFPVGNHVRAVLQEARERQLKIAIPDDAVEDAFLRDEIALFFGDEGPRLAQLDGVADLRVALVADREVVDRFLEFRWVATTFGQCPCGADTLVRVVLVCGAGSTRTFQGHPAALVLEPPFRLR